MDQLIGMCNMILADGAVDDAEAKLLLNWMEANIYAAQDWPGNVLYERIVRAMVDDVIDPDEERELLEVIQQIAGSFPTQQSPPVSGAIPFDDPSPSIAYEGASFVVTGQFVFGTRRVVTGAIEKRGGTVKPACSKKVNYLLVGTIGSEEWLHSTHGTKIVKAVELKRAGSPIAIVREESWVRTL
jgi:NAD-dependent DNA ligase